MKLNFQALLHLLIAPSLLAAYQQSEGSINERNRFLANSNEGTFKILVILVQFSDHKNRKLPPKSHYENLCNGVNGNITGTIRDYFLQQSYGKYNITCDVQDWLQTDNTEAYYAAISNANSDSDSGAQFFLPVLNQLDENGIDWTVYDANGDYELDNLLVVMSGFDSVFGGGEKCGNGQANRIRAQGSPDSDTWESKDFVVELEGYAIVSAYAQLCNFDVYTPLGVPLHELTHTFGAIDTYDKSTGEIGGLGSFDVMADLGGYQRNENKPGSLSPLTKQLAGWLSYIDITQDGVYTIRPSNVAPDIYKISGKYPSGQYLVIENRQPTSYDDLLFNKTGGLLIYYADDNIALFGTRGYPGQSGWPQNGNRYRLALLQADGKYDLEKGVNGGDAGDLWLPGMTLGPGPNYPNTDAYGAGSTGIKITNITALGNGVMSFRVVGLKQAPAGPSTVTAAPTVAPTAAAAAAVTVAPTGAPTVTPSVAATNVVSTIELNDKRGTVAPTTAATTDATPEINGTLTPTETNTTFAPTVLVSTTSAPTEELNATFTPTEEVNVTSAPTEVVNATVAPTEANISMGEEPENENPPDLEKNETTEAPKPAAGGGTSSAAPQWSTPSTMLPVSWEAATFLLALPLSYLLLLL